MSLIEIAVGLAIVAIVLTVGLPSFGTWVQNSKIRTAAESIQNGLQQARSEAVRRNTAVRFQFTSSLDASCALSSAAANWIISLDDPSGNCAGAVINEAFPITDDANNPSPRIIQRRTAEEGTSGVSISVLVGGAAPASPFFMVFNGLGRITTPMTTNISIDVANTSGGASCVGAATGSKNMRCLRVQVSGGGQIRLCDPALAAGDPQSC